MCLAIETSCEHTINRVATYLVKYTGKSQDPYFKLAIVFCDGRRHEGIDVCWLAKGIGRKRISGVSRGERDVSLLSLMSSQLFDHAELTAMLTANEKVAENYVEIGVERISLMEAFRRAIPSVVSLYHQALLANASTVSTTVSWHTHATRTMKLITVVPARTSPSSSRRNHERGRFKPQQHVCSSPSCWPQIGVSLHNHRLSYS